MHIDVLTAFPDILQQPLDESILKQAKKRIELDIQLHDLRQFALDKHRVLDDTPYGGGPGMVFKAEPLFRAFESIPGVAKKNAKVIYPSPQGRLFTQEVAQELSECENLIFLCGHYKAIDERVIETWVTDEISVGDFVLSGGEIPALLMIDGLVRLIPGVLNDLESAKTDSFQDGLLDCTYYTRPEVFRDMAVPPVLLSGNHAKINEWRQQQRLERTKKRRPDLYQAYLDEINKRNDKIK